ncbi:hypothetical protein AGABI1DRAFT_123293 [Agaricus bisporus var. burnettii JB137-S8]|uniref:Uncharacterized protein n=1 Tax=Agaricus bisporus var. burnettii (strain JB137-S8 / ATCC MYA-4627 / FGSC 10392) TaxID=597362 RepID=K5VLI5_AGABU|nr:uncharacterized protein AGABI1DRAFT_123293 [Agaricus bisporus var. burnettii JB137-S8]EKM75254.1 hypothetical protein AGABI1DRAFT_123293 [Agaricus bisporus var. burnettii JB137-S8]
MGKAVEATALVSEQALKLLKTVDSFVSIPGVGAAAEAALSILELAQTVKSNKAEFISVGEKACTIMVTIVEKVNAAEQPGRQTDMSSLEKECGNLRGVMEEVEEIVHKHVKRRKRCVLLQRILYSQRDQDAIKDCKERLQNALDLFTVQSHIEVRQGVEDANNKLDQLAERRSEGLITTTQYTGGDAFTHIADNSVKVNGTGNSVNVSSFASSPSHYPPWQRY